jgi:3-phenylpropionate/trans-cinnamate dioxygenase ferredoxin component
MLKKQPGRAMAPLGAAGAGLTPRKRQGTIRAMIACQDSGDSADWRAVASVADFADGRPRGVLLEGHLLVLARVGETYCAAQGLCPHERSDLSLGRIEEGRLVCPRHLLSFDLGSGAPSKGWSLAALKLYPARKSGAQIEVDVAAIRRDPPLGPSAFWNLSRA